MLDTLRSVLRFQRPELDPVVRRLRRAANVHDLRRIARRRLPRGVFDYIDGAAEDERTLHDNSAAFAALRFQPRVLRDVGAVDTSTTILGSSAPLPLVLAPTGFGRIADPQGELAVARAAARAGLPYTLSTLGTRSIEEVAAVSNGRRWFQVYMWRDRGLVAPGDDGVVGAAEVVGLFGGGAFGGHFRKALAELGEERGRGVDGPEWEASVDQHLGHDAVAAGEFQDVGSARQAL